MLSLKLSYTLLDFVTKFDMELRQQRSKEYLRADYMDKHEVPKCQIMYHIESKMAGVYTRTQFIQFSNKLLQSQRYKRASFVEGSNMVYNIEREDASPLTITHKVTYDIDSDFAMCPCKKFEFKVIPCSHIIFFYHTTENGADIPNVYILPRWTKGAKCGIVISDGEEIKEIFNGEVLDHSILLGSKLNQLKALHLLSKLNSLRR